MYQSIIKQQRIITEITVGQLNAHISKGHLGIRSPHQNNKPQVHLSYLTTKYKVNMIIDHLDLIK